MSDTPRPLRLVLMGTGPFAVPSYQRILESDDEVLLVVSRPTIAAVGRTKGPINPVMELAESYNCETYQPESINSAESIEKLRQLKPDLLVVCDYGQILSKETLATAKMGGINLHGSLLPRHRGAAPIQWAILSGDVCSGVSVIHMTPRLDGGPIIAELKTRIIPTETAGDLEHRLSEMGTEAVETSLNLLRQWDGHSTIGAAQDPSLVTKAPRLSKKDGEIRWENDSDSIARHIRAMQPWPGSYTELLDEDPQKNIRLILRKCISLPAASSPNASPGSVVQVSPSLLVSTGKGLLEIQTLQPAGKREMSAEEFLRGKKVPIGAKLGKS